MWGYIGSLFLLLGIFIIFYLILTKTQSTFNLSSQFILKPFAGKISAQTGVVDSLTLSDGVTPQISCPGDSEVNILGAFFDVYDPNAVCSQSSSPAFLSSCGLDQDSDGNFVYYNKACLTGADCGPSGLLGCYNAASESFNDSKGGFCAYYGPDTGVTSCSAIPTGPSMGVPAIMAPNTFKFIDGANGNSSSNICLWPSCTNINGNGISSVCGPSTDCRQRNATPYLAEKCNGTSVCMPDITQDFGPYPCNIVPPTAGCGSYVPGNSNAFCNLPYTSGSFNNVPGGATPASPSSYNMGYFVHGVYTCVPKP